MVRELIRHGERHNRKHLLHPEFVQCSSRFFITWKYIEKMSLRLASARSSILAEAKTLLYQRNDEHLAHIPQHLKDAPSTVWWEH